MRYLGILKDSLLEAIDSKVFYVVGAISVLAIGLMATVTLEPIPSGEGFQRISTRFKDGAEEIDLPLIGRTKATPSFAQFSIREVKGPEQPRKPWEAEYQLTIEGRDLVPMGNRIVALQQILQAEEERERIDKTGRKTRAQRLQQEIEEEVRRIQEAEEKKGKGRLEGQQEVLDRLMAFITQRLEQEVNTLTNDDLEQFIRAQMEGQGNWNVTEVQTLVVPESERTVHLKTKVPVREGNDVRIKTEDKTGEVRRYQVTVKPRGATYLGWPHKASLLFGGIPLGNSVMPGDIVSKISSYVISSFGAPVIMLLSCIITAFYIPNMLRKGTIDLLLAKPVSRTGLLFYKYIGGLTFMVINTTVLIIGLWLVLGLRTSVWETAFLYAIPILTFEFALFYALSTLTAVLTRSPIVCILACVLMWGLLTGVGWGYYLTKFYAGGEGWFSQTMEVAHAGLPHYLDLDWLGEKALYDQTLLEAEQVKLAPKYRMFNWSESILVTSLYILVFLGLACWRFAAQDY